MKNETRIRFNLGRGKNYKKWKIEIPGKKPSYYDPEKVQLVILNGTLHNDEKTAKKIHKGESKRVCAWIFPEVFLVLKGKERIPYEAFDALNIVRYNPKVKPNWVYLSRNVDGHTFPVLVTKGSTVFNRVHFY